MPTHEKIPWDDRYKLGIEMIDTQHKKLFALVNKLYDLEEHKSTKDELRVILYEFSDYMNTHFKDEEEYMSSIEYPELQEHKKLHQDLIDYLASVIKTPAKLDIIKTKMRIVAKRALIDHITHEDTKIKLYEISKLNPEKLIYDTEADEEVFDISNIVADD